MTLGRTPEQLILVLNPGADFTANLKVQKAGQAFSWPANTTLLLAIQADPRSAEQRWNFQLSGSSASIVIPAAELRPLITRIKGTSRARIYLQYGDDRPILWAAGMVRVNG